MKENPAQSQPRSSTTAKSGATKKINAKPTSISRVARTKPNPSSTGLGTDLFETNLFETNLFETVVKEGDMITLDSSGEQLKIAKIEGGTITIEKSP